VPAGTRLKGATLKLETYQTKIFDSRFEIIISKLVLAYYFMG